LKIDYSLEIKEKYPESIKSLNEFTIKNITPNSDDIKLFDSIFTEEKGKKDAYPSLYIGLDLAPGQTVFPNRDISLYISLENTEYQPPEKDKLGKENTENQHRKPPRLEWQYWNGEGWQRLSVQDETRNFTRSGSVIWIAPPDISAKEDFGHEKLYWLRVQWRDGDYERKPKLKRIQLNTVNAIQTTTIRDEILGSSDGSKNQSFKTSQKPIVRGQKLEVRELDRPSKEEQEKLISEEGDDAIRIVRDAAGKSQQILVRWHEVTDFYGSTGRDRHYTLNALTGEVIFGNKVNGLVPPPGAGNIRMRQYRTGGGIKANSIGPSKIVQLRTTIPYIDGVTNYDSPQGGSEAESIEALKERIPRTLRHQRRAVTFSDYEDLAVSAFPQVARAKCIPLLDLKANPLTPELKPGAVSLIIVPESLSPKPLPSLELLGRVEDYLKSNCHGAINVSVVGPLYIQVSVVVTIVPLSAAGTGALERKVDRALREFIHPLTGGFDGKGWHFGRKPYESNFYHLLEGIEGVDYVSSLELKESKDIYEPEAVEKTKRFLVYSGQHEITFEPVSIRRA
jgi:predicted phage baseplate assembly protein